jgi:L-glutamine:2-deoxy-scyllo-inosose/3-amino-2,3-dideoxy-scyllo-inosose aminotransferase
MTATRTPAPALLGGKPAVTAPQPAWPVTGAEEGLWLQEVLASGKWSWLGPHETAFCREFADFIGAEHAVALANGTVTLQCALQAVGVEPGHEVIVPGLTWVATAQAALDVGANVVLADVDPETLCLCPEAVRAAVTPRTKAIIPVHLYGCMCDMDALLEIAREHDLRIVEDVAHQHGSAWRGTRAGAIGDAGSYSFQQSKILTSGEGGAVTTNDAEVYRCVFALKQVGWAPDPDAPAPEEGPPPLVRAGRYAHNYRITEMQCALLRGGLGRLAEQNRRREESAAYLAARLAERAGPLRVARRDPRVTEQAYYALTLHYDEAAAGLPKGHYLRALRAEGVPVQNLYDPVYRNPLMNLYDRTSPVPYRDPQAVQNYRDLHLPNVEAACASRSLLLNHPSLLGDAAYLDQVLDGIGRVHDNLGRLAAHVAD